MFDTDEAYFLARLDSLVEGGTAPFEEVQHDIRGLLMRRRKTELMATQAQYVRGTRQGHDAGSGREGARLHHHEVATCSRGRRSCPDLAG